MYSMIINEQNVIAKIQKSYMYFEVLKHRYIRYFKIYDKSYSTIVKLLDDLRSEYESLFFKTKHISTVEKIVLCEEVFISHKRPTHFCARLCGNIDRVSNKLKLIPKMETSNNHEVNTEIDVAAIPQKIKLRHNIPNDILSSFEKTSLAYISNMCNVVLGLESVNLNDLTDDELLFYGHVSILETLLGFSVLKNDKLFSQIDEIPSAFKYITHGNSILTNLQCYEHCTKNTSRDAMIEVCEYFKQMRPVECPITLMDDKCCVNIWKHVRTFKGIRSLTNDEFMRYNLIKWLTFVAIIFFVYLYA